MITGDVMNYLGLVSALFIVVGLVAFSLQVQPAWSSRGFNVFDGQWGWIFALSSFVSLFTFYILFTNRNYPLFFTDGQSGTIPIYVILAMVIMAFVLTLSGWTDLLSQRAPMEIAHIAMVLGLPLMVGYFISIDDWSGIISFFIWAGITSAMWWFLGDRGFGDADIRILWVITTCLSWWAGWYMTFMLFGLACVLQMIIHLTSNITKIGEYTMVRPFYTTVLWRKIIMWYNRVFKKKTIVLNLTEAEPKYVTPLLVSLCIVYTIVPILGLIYGVPYLLINGGLGIFSI